MSFKVAVGTSSFAKMDETPKHQLEEAGIEVIPNPFGRKLTEEETIEFLTDIDGLIAGLEPLNRKVLASAKKLKALARVGIGMTNVDMTAASELGIKVSNTPEEPAFAVAELTLTACLALLRRFTYTNSELHAGRWTKTIGQGLAGSHILVIGYGHIGRRVAAVLGGMGAIIMVADPAVTQNDLHDNEQLVKLEDGLAKADVVTLHASGIDTIIGTKEFSLMKQGAYLLNAARGELVDEQAVIEALKTEKINGAWFDAFWHEPYTGELLNFEQVLLTPHVGTYSKQCRLSMETKAVANLLRDLGLTK